MLNVAIERVRDAMWCNCDCFGTQLEFLIPNYQLVDDGCTYNVVGDCIAIPFCGFFEGKSKVTNHEYEIGLNAQRRQYISYKAYVPVEIKLDSPLMIDNVVTNVVQPKRDYRLRVVENNAIYMQQAHPINNQGVFFELLLGDTINVSGQYGSI